MNFDILRQRILEKAIQGKLVPQLESEPEVAQISETLDDVPFTVPEKWKWVRILDAACINPKVIATDSNINVSFIPMAAVSAGYLNYIDDEKMGSIVFAEWGSDAFFYVFYKGVSVLEGMPEELVYGRMPTSVSPVEPVTVTFKVIDA